MFEVLQYYKKIRRRLYRLTKLKTKNSTTAAVEFPEI